MYTIITMTLHSRKKPKHYRYVLVITVIRLSCIFPQVKKDCGHIRPMVSEYGFSLHKWRWDIKMFEVSFVVAKIRLIELLSLLWTVIISACKEVEFRLPVPNTSRYLMFLNRISQNVRHLSVFTDGSMKEKVLSALQEISMSTYAGGKNCITFVPRQNEPDYVEFTSVVL